MRIKVIGGGPAGLYFSILVKKSFPHAEIHVVERNKADDTFGFGVVFSDQTLDNFHKADRESYEAITKAFAYWDDIAIQIRGENFRIGGKGRAGHYDCAGPHARHDVAARKRIRHRFPLVVLLRTN